MPEAHPPHEHIRLKVGDGQGGQDDGGPRMKVKRKRCVCGFMADVDEWNSKGVAMYCPECGGYELTRDDLYGWASRPA